MNAARLFGALCCIGATSVPTWANASDLPPITDLKVIHDSGRGQSIFPYIGFALKRLDSAAPTHKEPATSVPSAAQVLSLPLRTSLTVGKQPNQAIPDHVRRGLTHTAFVVGADAYSMQWLAVHQQQLTHLGAVGLLIEAETIEDVDRVIAAAGVLSITPINLDQVAAAMGLQHYPAFVSKDGISASVPSPTPRAVGAAR